MFHKLLIAILLLCGIALAQPPQGAPGMHGGPGFGEPHRHFGPPDGGRHMLLPPGRWWKNAEVAKSIGLNDGQVQKIEQVFLDSRMKLVDAHASLEKEEIKLEPLLEADNPDESAVLSAIDRITAARASVEKANAQMAFAIRRVLTPEQWKKLRSLRPSRGHFPPPEGGPRRNFEHRGHDGEFHHPMHDRTPGGQPTPPANGAAPEASK
jgi:Spy/CpxP family protein refolding chaperone